MERETILYPQYRKYSNNKAFFKILSEDNFEEIQVLGDTVQLFSFEAKILPDRNYINDLTHNYTKNWVLCEPEEYEELRKRASYS